MIIKSVLIALFCIFFAYISCNTPKQQPDPLQILSDKYKSRSPKTVKLTAPGKITLDDTSGIAKASRLYMEYAKQNSLSYYQTQSKISITKGMKDSITKEYNYGIRIYKGLTEPLSTNSQNQIIKYVDSIGYTRKIDSNFLVFDYISICSDKCENLFISANLPTANASLEAGVKCNLDLLRYDSSSKRDDITSILITKEIIVKLIDSGASFFNLYNGIDTKNQRILYLLSYDAQGKLLIDASFSLDMTYMCPNYCDGTRYFK